MTAWLKKKPVVLYTDGSCMLSAGGIGGWAAVLLIEGVVTELHGSEIDTTNNRMEMTACVVALLTLPSASNVFLHSDSQYVVRGIRDWVPAWKRKNWLTVQGKLVANKDLWLMLDAENSRHLVTWHWVRGHDGDQYNERCDELAKRAALMRKAMQKGV